MLTDFFYLIIFLGNIFGFCYYGLEIIKEDKKYFNDLHSLYKCKNEAIKEIKKIVGYTLFENALICVYIFELLGFISDIWRLNLVRFLFVMNVKYISSCNFILLQIFHRLTLSYFILGFSPVWSLFVHVMDNVLINIFRFYLHSGYDIEYRMKKDNPLVYELEKVREKRIVSENLSFWFAPQTDDITTPKIAKQDKID